MAEIMEIDAYDCPAVSLDNLSSVKFTNEIWNVMKVLTRQPFGKGRKKLSKQDIKDIHAGKIASDFQVDLAVSPHTSTEKVVKKSVHKTPLIKRVIPSSSVPSSTLTTTARTSGRKPCPHCLSRRFRVVDPGRPDGKRILECARRDCLASISFTSLPEGTMMGDTLEEGSYGWYLKDPAEVYYPRVPLDKNYTFDESVRKTESLRDDMGRVAMRCPGQKKLVPIL